MWKFDTFPRFETPYDGTLLPNTCLWLANMNKHQIQLLLL